MKLLALICLVSIMMFTGIAFGAQNVSVEDFNKFRQEVNQTYVNKAAFNQWTGATETTLKGMGIKLKATNISVETLKNGRETVPSSDIAQPVDQSAVQKPGLSIKAKGKVMLKGSKPQDMTSADIQSDGDVMITDSSGSINSSGANATAMMDSTFTPSTTNSVSSTSESQSGSFNRPDGRFVSANYRNQPNRFVTVDAATNTVVSDSVIIPVIH